MRNPLTVVSWNFFRNIFREVKDEPWEPNDEAAIIRRWQKGTRSMQHSKGDHHWKRERELKTILNASMIFYQISLIIIWIYRNYNINQNFYWETFSTASITSPFVWGELECLFKYVYTEICILFCLYALAEFA